MGNFSESTDLQYSHKTSDNVYIYKGRVDQIWSVGAVPYGGFVMSLVINGAFKHQKSTKHPDPVHVTGYFMRSASVGDIEVHVEEVKKGFSLTFLTVKLMQKNNICILSQQVFTELGPMDRSGKPVSNDNLNLTPPYHAARQIPVKPIQDCPKIDRSFDRIKFGKYYDWHQDFSYFDRNKALAEGKDEARLGGFSCGSWLEFTDPKDTINPVSFGFFSDMFMNTTSLLPKDVRPTTFWYPTVQMSIEFKQKMTPENLAGFHERRVGLYSTGAFLNDGRHEIYQEMWTSPTDEEFKRPGWREKQQILAITSQFAMMVPMEVNLRRASKA